jgi:coproporphyrinogen III oxidase-like Fe-S oxidoreductase
MKIARVKRNVLYDDETLEKMKRYYKIDNNEELLRFIKTHGLKNYNFDINNS